MKAFRIVLAVLATSFGALALGNGMATEITNDHGCAAGQTCYYFNGLEFTKGTCSYESNGNYCLCSDGAGGQGSNGCKYTGS